MSHRVLGCAIEVHRTLGQRLLINLHVERLRDGIRRLKL